MELVIFSTMLLQAAGGSPALEFTSKEIMVGVLGSGGLVGGLVALMVYASGRLDKRRERREQAEKKREDEAAQRIHDSVEQQKSNVQQLRDIIAELRQSLAEKNVEIDALEADLKAEREAARLDRPAVKAIIREAREITQNINAMSVLLLSDADTLVFNRRFGAIRESVVKIEELLP